MQSLGIDKRSFETVKAKLAYLAWRRYRIPTEQAEDVVQNAITTYLEVRDRYDEDQNHLGILAGIFRNKCREHITESVREQKMMDRYRATPPEPAATSWLDPDGGGNGSVLDEVIRREDGLLIMEALADLSPSASETLNLLLEEDVGRKGLIRRLGLNKNTLDSRLHVYRRELRRLLRQRGILI